MAEKRQKRDPELEAQIKQQTSLEGMLGSLEANLTQGAPLPKSQSSASKNPAVGGVLQPEDHHMDLSSLEGSLPRSSAHGDGHRIGKNAWGQSLLLNNPDAPTTPEHPQEDGLQNANLGDLTPIIADVLSFRYSENREAEIKQLRSALQTEMTRLCAKRVVSNTQKSVKTAKNFYMGKSGSLRLEFSILGQKYSMHAQGAFRGDEILYPTVEGDNVVGLVMRDGPEGLENATSEFKISINQGWKE